MHSSGVSQQVVASCSVIDITSVETLDHELAWESEVFAHFQSFLIDVLR